MRTDVGGGSLQSRILGLATRHTAKRVIHAWSWAPWLPWPYFVVDHAGRLQRSVLDATFEPVELAHCRAELVRTPASDSGRHVVYFHGGAFVVGGRLLHRALVSRIAHATRSTVLAVEYRKLPRHAIHTSTADSLDGYRYVLDQGVAADDIVLMGDSAGGFLTFTVADGAASAGLPLPAGLVAMSPLVDFDLTRTPLQVGRRGCDVFARRAIPAFARLAARKAGGHGLRAPADCGLQGMPPVLIQASADESLYSHAVAMHDLLDAAGVDVELQVWNGQVHFFQVCTVLPEARQAVDQIAEFVERVAPVERLKTA